MDEPFKDLEPSDDEESEKKIYDDGEINPESFFENAFQQLPKRPIIPKDFPDIKVIYKFHPFSSIVATESGVNLLKTNFLS